MAHRRVRISAGPANVVPFSLRLLLQRTPLDKRINDIMKNSVIAIGDIDVCS